METTEQQMSALLVDVVGASDHDGNALHEYVQQLRECLCGWDPIAAAAAGSSTSDSNKRGAAMRDFVDALTEIAALPLDAMSMEVRRLLVDSSAVVSSTAVGVVSSHNNDNSNSGDADAIDGTNASSTPVARILSALSSRDVLLKCKAANALGSLCISRVAGQQLLDVHGTVALQRLERMATCKHRWAQADAFFVLGWIVVIADDAMLARVAQLVPTVMRFLRRSVETDDISTAPNIGQQRSHSNSSTAIRDEFVAAPTIGRHQHRRHNGSSAATEDASNVRVYALVLLLNCLQRDATIFRDATQCRELLATLDAVMCKLNAYAASIGTNIGTTSTTPSDLEATEFGEVLRLTVTLLSLVVDQVAEAAALVLELKMLPALLRLRRVLAHAQTAGLLDHDTADDATDLDARMAAIIATVVARR